MKYLQIKYGGAAVEKNGQDFDWQNAPIDAQAVYSSGGGKAHGRFAMFDGLIDSRAAIPPRGSTSSSGSCQRISQRDLEVQALQEKLRVAEEKLESHQALSQAQQQQQQQLQQQLEQQAAAAKAKDEYLAAYTAQLQAAMQVLAQQHGQQIVIPSWQPPPDPQPMTSSSIAQASGINLQTPTPNIPAPDSNQEDPHDGTMQLVNSVLRSGGSSNNQL